MTETDAARAIVRRETLEEAAKVIEARSSVRRIIYAKQNNLPIAPCADAAAIRALGEK